MEFSINSKMAVVGRLTERPAALFNGLLAHYKQWRAAGAIENLMTRLSEATREQVKKKKLG